MCPSRFVPASCAEFEQHALPHLRELFAAGMRMARSTAEAEDLVQETFLRAYAGWHRFEPGTNVRAWLFRILTNAFINGWRERARAARIEEHRLLEASYSDETRAAAGDPEGHLAGAHLSDEMAVALGSLPPGYRAAVVLAELHDFSYAEIADALGVPTGTVMSRLHRGRRMLLERYERLVAATAAGQAGGLRAA
jgi:RNA polymerase sigma-70 factor, ECF subfamily